MGSPRTSTTVPEMQPPACISTVNARLSLGSGTSAESSPSAITHKRLFGPGCSTEHRPSLSVRRVGSARETTARACRAVNTSASFTGRPPSAVTTRTEMNRDSGVSIVGRARSEEDTPDGPAPRSAGSSATTVPTDVAPPSPSRSARSDDQKPHHKTTASAARRSATGRILWRMGQGSTTGIISPSRWHGRRAPSRRDPPRAVGLPSVHTETGKSVRYWCVNCGRVSNRIPGLRVSRAPCLSVHTLRKWEQDRRRPGARAAPHRRSTSEDPP